MTDLHTHESAVEAAVDQVLRAEQAARGAIEAARADAANRAEQARAAARLIDERTRRRIQRVRAAFAREAQVRLAAIDALASSFPGHDEPTPRDLERLQRAVRALAARLTGGDA